MNDQHAHAGHVGYDNNPTGSFDIDPLFGAIAHAPAGYESVSHGGGYETGAWDTGSHQSADYGTYAEPQQIDPFVQVDPTGQWDAAAWNQTGHTGQFDTAAATFVPDSTGQWTVTGADSGAYDATAWNVGTEAGVPQQFTPDHEFTANDFGVNHGDFGAEAPSELMADHSQDFNAQDFGTQDFNAQDFSAETFQPDAYGSEAFQSETYGPDAYDTGSYPTGTYEAGGYESGHQEVGAFDTGSYETTSYETGSYTFAAHEDGSEPGSEADLNSTGELGPSLDPEPDHTFVFDVDLDLAHSAPETAFAADDDTDADADQPSDEELGLITPVAPVTPRPVRRSHGSSSTGRGRRRTPAKRSAFLTVAVPSACVMGVAGIAAASVGGLSGGDAKKDDTTKLAAADVASSAATTAAANNKMDTQLAALHAEARDFGDRASRTQERIDLKVRQEAERKKREEEAKRREALRPKFSLPVRQNGISAYYGQSGVNWVSLHTGIDFPVGYGTEVLAATDGTVRTQFNSAYGNMVILTAPDGTETWYCHLSSAKIRSGTVKAGEVIAYAGDSGKSTGPHLHFEVRPGGGAAINPLPWLQSHGLNPV
ncbi:M23 family metallopeptidase [Streptomyces sp. NPDC059256]|uniref:M23 family metallopeptidase n=1 Tax=Streptomyces sp. NPDC059256 TaxID=3346794 RepID=UPI003696C2E8